MKITDLPDDFTDEQFMQLDKESLDAIPYTRRRWLCICKKCNNGTTLRDYGLNGWYFLNRNSKRAKVKTADYWIGKYHYWLCGKHNKLFIRLKKRFTEQEIYSRLFDGKKVTILPAEEKLETTLKVEKKHQNEL